MNSYRQEREELLNAAASKRSKGFGKGFGGTLKTIFCVLLLLLALFTLSRFIKLSIQVHVGSKNQSFPNGSIGLWSQLAHRHNILLGVKKCRRLNCDELDFLNDTCRRKVSSFFISRNFSYYFVTDDAALTFTQACSLESFAQQLPDTTVYSLRLLCNRRPEEYPGADVRKELSRKYRNIKLLSINGQCFFKDTPFDDEWRCGNDKVLRGAQALVVWRFGGVSIYPDVVLANRTWGRDQIQIGRTSLGDHVVGSVLPCSAPVYYYITVVERSYSTFLADPTLDTYKKFCKTKPCSLVYLSDQDACGDWNCSLVFLGKQLSSEKLQDYCPKSIALYKPIKTS